MLIYNYLNTHEWLKRQVRGLKRTALAKYLGSVPRIHIKCLKTAYNSNSRRIQRVCSLWALAHTHVHKYTQRNIMKENLKITNTHEYANNSDLLYNIKYYRDREVRNVLGDS